MSHHQITYIQSGNLQIAASCESNIGKSIDVYHPSTLLIYMQTGTLHIKIDGNTHTIHKGNFALLRKYTEAKMFKSWSSKEDQAKTFGFMLTNTFIDKVIHKIHLPKNINNKTLKFVNIPSTKRLKELMTSLISYVDEGKEIDESVIELKTLQALKALSESDKNILLAFHEFSLREQANIEKLMHLNFLNNIPLKNLAEQSGRSLSAFNRDFRIIFNETPHRWIIKKRLYYAVEIMKTQKVKASKVYLEAGFEDLSHFSRAFKRQFKMTPTEYYRTNIK